MLKSIPEDAGSFFAIRTAKPQMLYVDKTAYLHRLVTSGRTCLFLVRPGADLLMMKFNWEKL